ncbi:MAG: S1C family serine protease [Fimbriiglobus sp.]|jgi:serine protease Do|nr:S1C family serine protease [Fimbriiglobus sp.]
MRLRLWALGLSALTASPVLADEPPKQTSIPAPATALSWATGRITSPETVDELKALQTKVKAVYQKSLPTTVGLLLGGQGGGSAGSGVIVSADGLVLTAAHVIGRPREAVAFVLADGRTVKGITLGLNSQNDSGMAKITDPPPKDFPGAKDGKWPFSEIGTSAELKKGQWIVSMGHPGGPKRDRPPPVRTGRFLSYDKASAPFRRNDLLCTDATLVGGDSGGPLFDLDGKVVGIHSEIGMTLDENRHVPTEKFKDEWDRMARGDILFFNRRSGGREQATKVTLNAKFDEKAKGAKVEELVDVNGSKGAAEKAGIEAGDVITKFNGFAVKSADDLANMLPSYKVGETVKVEVSRDGANITVDLKLADKAKK